jgi:hypothetical protein
MSGLAERIFQRRDLALIGFLHNLYRCRSISLSIFYKLSSHPLTQDSSMECAGVMSINWEPDSRLAQLAEQIRLSQEPTSNLLSRVIAETSLLLPAPADLVSGRRIENLVHANAWVDAVLVLIDVELPQWKCRRLLYDERNWNCSLSRFPDLPIELDDTADGQHEALSPAILLAFVEACRVTITKRESDKFAVGQVPAVAAQRRGSFDRARDRRQP